MKKLTINEIAEKAGVSNSELNFNNEKEYVEQMVRCGAEGFIIQSTYRFGMLAASLEKRRKPLVYLGTRPYDVKGRYVKSNHYECVYQMVTGCIGKGYDAFVMVAGDASDKADHPGDIRDSGACLSGGCPGSQGTFRTSGGQAQGGGGCV